MGNHAVGLRRFAQQLRFFGFSRECVFCRSRLRRFLPFGLDVPELHAAQVVIGARLAEARPCYHDERYVVEFSRDGLQACLEAAGWRVTRIDVRDGALLALADA